MYRQRRGIVYYSAVRNGYLYVKFIFDRRKQTHARTYASSTRRANTGTRKKKVGEIF